MAPEEAKGRLQSGACLRCFSFDLCNQFLEFRVVQQISTRTRPYLNQRCRDAADFGFEPFCFDHAALVPIVCTMVPRPKQDGFMVYAQGPEDSMQYLAEYLHGATAPASAG